MRLGESTNVRREQDLISVMVLLLDLTASDCVLLQLMVPKIGAPRIDFS